MDVKVLTVTENPADIISIAAGTSYGKDDPKFKRLENCFKMGHMSVFEHANITLRIDGISRACSHQLVRHRLMSVVQKSQRYTRIDTNSDWYVMPPSFDNSERSRTLFVNKMKAAAIDYNNMLMAGIKPEDARFLLPEACKTELTVTMNFRQLFHFLDMRTDPHAQWEIRDLAEEIIAKAKEYDEQTRQIIELWEVKNGRLADV